MNLEMIIRMVDRDHYVLTEDGNPLTQSTATRAILKSLQLLEVKPGDRVLEIGTGSGYSTALIAQLVGEKGHVVSLDIDPIITERAQQRLMEDNIENATLITRDGREGHTETAPFDRIIAWATADHLPKQWIDQLKNSGIIVAPFMLVPLAQSMAIARLRKYDKKIVGEQLIQGAYICMNETPDYASLGPELRADVVLHEKQKVGAWASSQWMKQVPLDQRRQWMMQLQNSAILKCPLKGGENYDAFRAFLLVKQPTELTTIYFAPMGMIGVSTSTSYALLSEERTCLQNGTLTLNDYLEEWRSIGHPGMDNLKPIVRQINSVSVVQAAFKID
ncbi:protein-L-isoaspartate(D-aspartate) O-methyltransferase [Seinonella peptonophila]|uniref:Protein-L-isoaspartate O-methyltransferase n=1 Tax=Seinonella peptonophila TaxID=112248 RepID=A0A1M4WF69_9BACL|nr:methyltransferase domain-containing protein [Seinonella peptonophila]SHE79899.1 protein-L-isoaspartate(D-aspartate) O-methyltransferase [Seinonella peptonophila]